MGEPEQQQHVLTVLSKKQIKRAIGSDDANFLIIYATRTQAECTEVNAVSLHYDCNSIWCLYLIILTSSIKTGAACIRCLEQKIGNGDAPAFVAPDDQHATRVQRKRRTGDHCTQDALLASARGRRSFQAEPDATRTFDRSEGAGQD